MAQIKRLAKKVDSDGICTRNILTAAQQGNVALSNECRQVHFFVELSLWW